VIMEMLWKRPFWSTNQLCSISVLVDVVLGIEQTLSCQDVDGKVYPVLGGAVGGVGDAILLQPLVYKGESVICWLDELVNLVVGEMLDGVSNCLGCRGVLREN